MPTDEEGGRVGTKQGERTAVVLRRATPDVRHPNTNAFEFEPLVGRIGGAQGAAIDVAMHGSHQPTRFPALDAGHDLRIADVTRMPDLIAGREVLLQAGIEPTVGIAEEADALHAAK